VFCPKCKDEFRAGFTRCGRCNVDLVEELPREETSASAGGGAPSAPVRLAEYCGYFSLDEARNARDRLRGQRIRSDIVVREPPDAAWDEPVREEYWLRVDISHASRIAAIIGDDPRVGAAAEGEETGFACGDCGGKVAADEVFCPECGARFDD
jgi:hypothetical protein